MIDKAVKLTGRGPKRRRAAGPTFPAAATKARSRSRRCRPCGRRTTPGFLVPRGTIEEAVRYLERCSTPEGGICYSLRSRRRAAAGRSRPPPWPRCTTPANSTRRSPTAAWNTSGTSSSASDGWNKGGGHDFYTPPVRRRRPSTWPATSTGTTIFPTARDQLHRHAGQGRRLVERRRHRQGLRHGDRR